MAGTQQTMAAKQFRIPNGYAIPEADDRKLRTIFGLTAPDDDANAPPLPQEVVAVYYACRRAADLLGTGMTDVHLALVATMATLGASQVEFAAPPEPHFLDVVDQKKVQPGELVMATWRNKETPGYFVEIRRDKVIVLIDGEERTLAPELVRPAKRNDGEGLPRNLNAS